MPRQPHMQAICTPGYLPIECAEGQVLRASAPRFIVGMHKPGCTGLAFAPADGVKRFVGTAVPQHEGLRPALRRTLSCFGIDEADVHARLHAMRTRWPCIRVQCRAELAELHVTLHAAKAREADLDAACVWAKAQLGVHAFATNDQSFAAVVLGLLRDRSASLALAEACTGGLMADLITDVPGCSDILHGSVVAYDNASKINLLGVRPATLSGCGAVSEQAVVEMAQGARRVLGSSYGLAVSGIAGPSGATSRKPVGTTWLGLAWDGGTTVKRLMLPDNRRGHKLWGACNGLDFLRRHLLSEPQMPPEQRTRCDAWRRARKCEAS